MIRINLFGPRVLLPPPKPWPWLCLALGVVLLAQLLDLGLTACTRAETRVAAETLRTRLRALEAKRPALSSETDLMATAGALTARNKWITAKNRSPIHTLARLEAGFPTGHVELISLEARPGTVALEALSPDSETVIRWLNTAFPGGQGRLSIEERHQDRLRIGFAWTE